MAMKKVTILLLAAAFAVSATAQQPESSPAPAQRNLKLMVRNPKGKVIRDQGLVALLKGSSEPLHLDRFGNRFFRVSDADTIVLITSGDIYEFPVAGFDSLYVVFKNRTKVAGVASRDGSGKMLNIGYGSVSREANTNSVSMVDMSMAYTYTSLKDYITARVAGVSFMGNQLIIRGQSSLNSSNEALIVVDGNPMPSFASANEMLSPNEVASISVLKDASASIYGSRGANGVVLITTKGAKGSK